MTLSPHQLQTRLDDLMEQASAALVARKYFLCERLALGALRKAHEAADYDRMARIALPLQESRRLKRQLAIDAGAVFLVDDEVPVGRAIVPGCYLVTPPRVGADARILRETADARETPVLVVAREPTTREGQWPVVTLGPITLRARVPAPMTPDLGHGADGRSHPQAQMPLPPPEWFVLATEALGDAAIASAMEVPNSFTRVDALVNRLESHPDHEKLHQALMDAARNAARLAPI